MIFFYYIFLTNGRWDEFDVKKHFREINNELFFKERGLAVTALGKVVGLNNWFKVTTRIICGNQENL